MSELLVRLVDKVNDDPRLDAACTKAGDVIVVAEDGHDWGKKEGPPMYRVVRVPAVAPVAFAGLLARQPARGDAVDHAGMLQARAFGLDLAALADVMTAEQVMAARLRKLYLADPDVLG